MNELIAIEKIAQWEKLKQLVLDSVSSPITKRVYNMRHEMLAHSGQRKNDILSHSPTLPWMQFSASKRALAA
jgi:hypothetical protein